LQDIQNNLKKPIYTDYLDLDNVYDFLSTVSASKGLSGFVTIKKPETRKRSYEPLKTEDPDFALSTQSPRIIREKSPISSPLPLKLSHKNASMITLRTIEENKEYKQKASKTVNIKNQGISPRQVVRRLAESNLKVKGGKDIIETTRERALSPYAITWQKSTGKLPLLQTSKKRIVGLKFEKVRKKSKGKK
jgi:hypothetical protein